MIVGSVISGAVVGPNHKTSPRYYDPYTSGPYYQGYAILNKQ